MTMVWQSDLPSERKFILLKLADHADDEGRRVFPSVASIAWHIGASERTIQRHMKALRDEGILEIVAPALYHWPTEYRIRGDKLSPLPARGVTRVTSRGDTDVTLIISNHHIEGAIHQMAPEEGDYFQERYARAREESQKVGWFEERYLRGKAESVSVPP